MYCMPSSQGVAAHTLMVVEDIASQGLSLDWSLPTLTATRYVSRFRTTPSDRGIKLWTSSILSLRTVSLFYNASNRLARSSFMLASSHRGVREHLSGVLHTIAQRTYNGIVTGSVTKA